MAYVSLMLPSFFYLFFLIYSRLLFFSIYYTKVTYDFISFFIVINIFHGFTFLSGRVTFIFMQSTLILCDIMSGQLLHRVVKKGCYYKMVLSINSYMFLYATSINFKLRFEW